jgi:hypothetical protein
MLEKFRFANEIKTFEMLQTLGNEQIRSLSYKFRAGAIHRNLLNLEFLDLELSKRILGENLKDYNTFYTNIILKGLNEGRNISDFFRSSFTYCPKCLEQGYHSYFHQTHLFDTCAYHPEEKLLDTCPNCKNQLPYMLSKTHNAAFQCECGHSFLKQTSDIPLFSIWREKLEIKNDKVIKWLSLSRNEIGKYHILYPELLFEYHYSHRDRSTDKKYTTLCDFILPLFDKGFTSSVSISSGGSKNVFEVYEHESKIFDFYQKMEKDAPLRKIKRIDDIFAYYFDAYKKASDTFKVTSKFIKRNIKKGCMECAVNDCKECGLLDLFNKWHEEFDLSKNDMGKQVRWDYIYVPKRRKYLMNINSKLIRELKFLLNGDKNKQNSNYTFDFFELNFRNTNYVISKILSFLMLESFNSWIEYYKKNGTLDGIKKMDYIPPSFLVKIPKYWGDNEKIEFVFRGS